MLALTVANLKMMARNRHTTLWSLIFPLMLVVVFGLFSNFVGIALLDDFGRRLAMTKSRHLCDIGEC